MGRALWMVAFAGLVGCQGQVMGPAAEADATPSGDDGGTATGDDAATMAPSDAGVVDVDASTPDAGSPDASGIAMTGCPRDPAVFFCDDFESGVIADHYRRDVRESGEVAVSDDGNAVSGSHTLLATIGTTAASRAMVEPGGVLPIAGNHFFGRAWFFFTPELPDVHAYLIEARGRLDGDNVRYRLDSNSGRLNSRYNSPAADAIQHGGFRKMGDQGVADRWTCIEWEYDGAANEMRYWFDGVENEDMRVTGSEDPPWLAPEFTSFSIGLHDFQATGSPIEVRWDDVALSTERIGCGPRPSP